MRLYGNKATHEIKDLVSKYFLPCRIVKTKEVF